MINIIKSNYNNQLKKLSKKKYEKSISKYSDKLKHSIEELHNKTSTILLTLYKEIIIGKVSIKKMISNLTGNLHTITKRRLIALSHYKFREKLKARAFKFGCKITEVSEYLTSKKVQFDIACGMGEVKNVILYKQVIKTVNMN